MFTGIITHVGIVKAIDKKGDWTFTIACDGFTGNLAIGASIACSGCCLTAIAWDGASFTVQVSQETLNCTTLGNWDVGTRLNLERALKVGDELGGHFVSGHVDAVVQLDAITPTADSLELSFTAPEKLSKFIAAKGSVTLDGISLTVNKVQGQTFTVNIIPHTQQSTTLADRRPGDRLNMEVDLIARYLMRYKETL